MRAMMVAIVMLAACGPPDEQSAALVEGPPAGTWAVEACGTTQRARCDALGRPCEAWCYRRGEEHSLACVCRM